jgi:hypothetical protein
MSLKIGIFKLQGNLQARVRKSIISPLNFAKYFTSSGTVHITYASEYSALPIFHPIW